MVSLFMQGFALGGTIPTYTALLTEFLPTERRGATVNMLMSSWTVGYAVVPFLGVFMLTPNGAGYNWSLFGQSGWRLIYILLCFCSSVATLGLALTVPESLRFLLLRGRKLEARRLLGRMARGNALSMPLALAEERLGLDDAPDEQTKLAAGEARNRSPDQGQQGAPMQAQLLLRQEQDRQDERQSLGEQLSLLFAPGMRRTTLCLWCIWFPISFAGNGFAVFLPMMQRLRHVPSRDVMVDNVLWAAAGTVGILFGSTLLEAKSLGTMFKTYGSRFTLILAY